jgi:hypothetical protein
MDEEFFEDMTILMYLQRLRPSSLGAEETISPVAGPDFDTLEDLLRRMRKWFSHEDLMKLERDGYTPEQVRDLMHQGITGEDVDYLMEQNCHFLNLERSDEKFYLKDILSLNKDPDTRSGASKAPSRPSGVYECRGSWRFWCNLLCQDERLNEDLMKRILAGETSGKQETTHAHLREPDMLSTWNEISRRVYEFFYRKPKALSSPADSLLQSQEAKPAKATEEDRSEGLARIFDSMTPCQYKEKWIEHCLSVGLTPAEVERRYGLNRTTVATWFRNYRNVKQ